MKRLLCCIIILALFVGMTCVSVSASEMEVLYLEDGSYITVQLEIAFSRASGTKTGNKVYTYYGSDGATDWKATLTGTFTYTGASVTCTAAGVDATVYDSAWYVVSKSAGKSGNKATASITMGEKVLGVTVGTVPLSLTLSCDADGNLS